MKRLLDAPHRVFFFAAAVQILLASAWWAATLLARAAGVALALPPGLAPASAHGLLMIYGFFPLFIFGFLFTAGPRWLEQPPPRRATYAAPALLAGASAWCILPALFIGPHAAATAVLGLMLAWAWLLGRYAWLIATSRVADRLHAMLAACALGVGLVGLAAGRLWLLTGSTAWATTMETLGLWGFLVPLVAYRPRKSTARWLVDN